MANFPITIDFRNISSHNQIVDALSTAFDAVADDTVHFTINLNTYSMLYSDHLVLIGSTVNHLRSIGVIVTGNFQDFRVDSAQVKYASRVNFFEQIGFAYAENFQRQKASGRFTEIKRFDDDNALDIHKEIVSILLKDSINDDMMTVLEYCLWEVMDNTIRHSQSDGTIYNGSGYISCQYFPSKKQIRIIVADNGQGIHQALTTHPNSKYKLLNEAEALNQSVNKGVTNSTGMGFGLWATDTLIRENGGKLIIHSGNHSLEIDNNKNLENTSKWQGVYTYIRVNTDVAVTYDKIFDDDGQKNAFEELKEKLLGNLDDLW
ncbi:ATP-binding protein [Olleya sp. YSTF-M6]|uniref:ATP-binding protein n=1 Tax=Olleya sediminilitoris TaxID=2795739 RepID=A0ABS1WIM3_9FLAO|nr:ATP-binding protein [Olleya sediminilitoris]MBL7558972.1 ATP-binding protein [Olleya sediminilitoris]